MDRPRFDQGQLNSLVAKFVEGAGLTPAEHAEVVRLAQGFGGSDSAAAAGLAKETIRARRKRIYRKLDVASSVQLQSGLLALALSLLAQPVARVG